MAIAMCGGNDAIDLTETGDEGDEDAEKSAQKSAENEENSNSSSSSTSKSDAEMLATNDEDADVVPVDTIVKMVSTGAMNATAASKMLKTMFNTSKSKKRTERRTDEVQVKKLLRTRWASRQQAIDVIKLHSTQQGKRVLVNRRMSNGKRVVMTCASSTSSTGNECKCNYQVVLNMSMRKGQAKPWAITKNTTLKNFHHCVMCTSQGQITYRELKKHLQSTTRCRTIPTINTTRDRIARDNKIPTSYVSKHVAVRARLEEAKQAASDYHANWSKLDRWGEQLRQRNPGSVVHVDVDNRGRFKRMFVGLQSAAETAVHTGTPTNW